LGLHPILLTGRSENDALIDRSTSVTGHSNIAGLVSVMNDSYRTKRAEGVCRVQ
jgi:hypothetical protein